MNVAPGPVDSVTRPFLVFATQRFWTEGGAAEADREADAAPPGGPR